jgi:hypothetical protein
MDKLDKGAVAQRERNAHEGVLCHFNEGYEIPWMSDEPEFRDPVFNHKHMIEKLSSIGRCILVSEKDGQRDYLIKSKRGYYNLFMDFYGAIGWAYVEGLRFARICELLHQRYLNA